MARDTSNFLLGERGRLVCVMIDHEMEQFIAKIDPLHRLQMVLHSLVVFSEVMVLNTIKVAMFQIFLDHLKENEPRKEVMFSYFNCSLFSYL